MSDPTLPDLSTLQPVPAPHRPGSSTDENDNDANNNNNNNAQPSDDTTLSTLRPVVPNYHHHQQQQQTSSTATNNGTSNSSTFVQHQPAILSTLSPVVPNYQNVASSSAMDGTNYLTGNANGGEINLSIDDAIERLGSGPFQRRILFAAGLCFASDSMEVLLLTFLTVVLRAQWDLSQVQSDSVTSAVFVGALVGTLVLGTVADRYGRRPVFVWTALLLCVAGFGTACVTSFPQLLVCRALVGFGVGGLVVPFDTLAEFVPSSERGRQLLAIEYFWTAGTLLVPVAAYVSLSNDGAGSWRLFCVLCAIPCLLSTLLGVLYVPESPRWLLSQSRADEALVILKEAAKQNGLDDHALYPPGTRLYDTEDVCHESCSALCSPKWRTLTTTLFGAWSGFAFCYYGTIIAITLVFENSDQNGNGEADGEEPLYSFDYAAIFASASAEFAGTTLILLLIDRVGRVPSQAASYVLGGVSVFVLCRLASAPAEDQRRGQLIAAAFLARMWFMSATCATWVSTAEVLTTEIRSTGHCAANAVARFSGAFSPYIISNNTSFRTIGSLILSVSVFTSLCTWQLPETTGKRMGATTQESASNHVDESSNMDDMGAIYTSASGEDGTIPADGNNGFSREHELT